MLNAVLPSDLHQPQPIFQNMKVMITENRDKDKGVINGFVGTTHSVKNNTLFIECGKNLIPVFPVTNEDNVTYYLVTQAYSTTIAEAQGQTIPHITILFDTPTLPPGCAYVAISRAKAFDNIKFLQLPTSSHFTPPLWRFFKQV